MEREKKATRAGFGEEIVELGKKDNGIYVVDADIGKSCKTTKFAQTLPKQHLNVASPSRMRQVWLQASPRRARRRSLSPMQCSVRCACAR